MSPIVIYIKECPQLLFMYNNVPNCYLYKTMSPTVYDKSTKGFYDDRVH